MEISILSNVFFHSMLHGGLIDFTIERIQKLINMNNESAAPLMKKLGLSSTSFSDWKRKKANPSTEAIVKIAKYFNVSTDYLLLENENPNKNFYISKDEEEWLDLYRQLSLTDSHNKSECIGFVKGYIARGEKSSIK